MLRESGILWMHVKEFHSISIVGQKAYGTNYSTYLNTSQLCVSLRKFGTIDLFSDLRTGNVDIVSLMRRTYSSLSSLFINPHTRT